MVVEIDTGAAVTREVNDGAVVGVVCGAAEEDCRDTAGSTGAAALSERDFPTAAAAAADTVGVGVVAAAVGVDATVGTCGVDATAGLAGAVAVGVVVVGVAMDDEETCFEATLILVLLVLVDSAGVAASIV